MRMNAQKQRAEIFGGGEEINFGFANNSKLISMFTDTFYTNKIESLIRELCTNAYDAHCEAGKKEEAFVVNLPGALSTMFRVRDFGKGVDTDFMMHKYTLIGYSTKDESDDFVGGFGWGRLSALAYMDSYTVASYQNGVKKTYLVYISEDKTPKVKEIDCCSTEESDGFEVSFPVESKDITSFKTAAEKVFLGFDVKPEGNAIVDRKRTHLTKNYYTVPGDSGYGKTYVRMGCVLYEVDFNSVASYEAATRKYASYTSNTAILDIPVGSVEVTVSRESLSYSRKTCKTLLEMFEQNLKELCKTLEKRVREASTAYEAAEIVEEYRPFSSIMRGFEVYWGDILLIPGLDVYIEAGNYPNLTFSTCFGQRLEKFQILRQPVIARKYSDKKSGISRDTYVKERVAANKSCVQDCREEIVVSVMNKAGEKDLESFLKLYPKTFKKYYVKDLPEWPHKKVSVNGGSSAKVRAVDLEKLVHCWGDFGRRVLEKATNTVEISEGGVYALKGGKALLVADDVLEMFYRVSRENLKNFFGNDFVDTLACVTFKQEDKLKEEGGWVKLEDYLEGLFKKHFSDGSKLAKTLAEISKIKRQKSGAKLSRAAEIIMAAAKKDTDLSSKILDKEVKDFLEEHYYYGDPTTSTTGLESAYVWNVYDRLFSDEEVKNHTKEILGNQVEKAAARNEALAHTIDRRYKDLFNILSWGAFDKMSAINLMNHIYNSQKKGF